MSISLAPKFVSTDHKIIEVLSGDILIGEIHQERVYSKKGSRNSISIRTSESSGVEFPSIDNALDYLLRN